MKRVATLLIAGLMVLGFASKGWAPPGIGIPTWKQNRNDVLSPVINDNCVAVGGTNTSSPVLLCPDGTGIFTGSVTAPLFIGGGGSGIPYSEKGTANGVATLDASAKLTYSEIPDALLGGVKFQGVYDIPGDSPTLPSCVSTTIGYYYITAVAGTLAQPNFDHYDVGDWVVCDATGWNKIDNVDSVTSVNGRLGDVVGLEEASNKVSDITIPSLTLYPSNFAVTNYVGAQIAVHDDPSLHYPMPSLNDLNNVDVAACPTGYAVVSSLSGAVFVCDLISGGGGTTDPSGWSLFPAVQNVNMNNFDITNARYIDASLLVTSRGFDAEGDSGIAGYVLFHENPTNGNNYIMLKAPEALSSVEVQVLPSNAGTIALYSDISAHALSTYLHGENWSLYSALNAVNMGGFNVSNVSLVDGVDVSILSDNYNTHAVHDDVSNWANYSAQQAVDMLGYDLQSVGDVDLQTLLYTPQPAEATSTIGMTAWADSTSWNPGEGPGLYVWNGAAWYFLMPEHADENWAQHPAIQEVDIASYGLTDVSYVSPSFDSGMKLARVGTPTSATQFFGLQYDYSSTLSFWSGVNKTGGVQTRGPTMTVGPTPSTSATTYGYWRLYPSGVGVTADGYLQSESDNWATYYLEADASPYFYFDAGTATNYIYIWGRAVNDTLGFEGHWVPETNNAWDVGSGSRGVRDIYVTGTVDGVNVAEHYTSSQSHWADTTIHGASGSGSAASWSTYPAISNVDLAGYGFSGGASIINGYLQMPAYVSTGYIGAIRFNGGATPHMGANSTNEIKLSFSSGDWKLMNYGPEGYDGTAFYTGQLSTYIGFPAAGDYIDFVTPNSGSILRVTDAGASAGVLVNPSSGFTDIGTLSTPFGVGYFTTIDTDAVVSDNVDGTDVSAFYSSYQSHYGDSTRHNSPNCADNSFAQWDSATQSWDCGSPGGGDNLGDHTATQDLVMSSFDINAVGDTDIWFGDTGNIIPAFGTIYGIAMTVDDSNKGIGLSHDGTGFEQYLIMRTNGSQSAWTQIRNEGPTTYYSQLFMGQGVARIQIGYPGFGPIELEIDRNDTTLSNADTGDVNNVVFEGFDSFYAGTSDSTSLGTSAQPWPVIWGTSYGNTIGTADYALLTDGVGGSYWGTVPAGSGGWVGTAESDLNMTTAYAIQFPSTSGTYQIYNNTNDLYITKQDGDGDIWIGDESFVYGVWIENDNGVSVWASTEAAVYSDGNIDIQSGATGAITIDVGASGDYLHLGGVNAGIDIDSGDDLWLGASGGGDTRLYASSGSISLDDQVGNLSGGGGGDLQFVDDVSMNSYNIYGFGTSSDYVSLETSTVTYQTVAMTGLVQQLTNRTDERSVGIIQTNTGIYGTGGQAVIEVDAYDGLAFAMADTASNITYSTYAGDAGQMYMWNSDIDFQSKDGDTANWDATLSLRSTYVRLQYDDDTAPTTQLQVDVNGISFQGDYVPTGDSLYTVGSSAARMTTVYSDAIDATTYVGLPAEANTGTAYFGTWENPNNAEQFYAMTSTAMYMYGGTVTGQGLGDGRAFIEVGRSDYFGVEGAVNLGYLVNGHSFGNSGSVGIQIANDSPSQASDIEIFSWQADADWYPGGLIGIYTTNGGADAALEANSGSGYNAKIQAYTTTGGVEQVRTTGDIVPQQADDTLGLSANRFSYAYADTLDVTTGVIPTADIDTIYSATNSVIAASDTFQFASSAYNLEWYINGANDPTLLVENGVIKYRHDGDATNHPIFTLEKSAQWFDPVDADDGIILWRATRNATITGVRCYVTGGTSVDINVTNSGSTVTSGGLTCTSAAWSSEGTLTNTAVSANTDLLVNTTTVTGTVTKIYVQLEMGD